MKLPENVKKAVSAIVTGIMTFWAIQEIAKNYGVALALPSPPSYQLILAFLALTAFPLWLGYQIHARQVSKQLKAMPRLVTLARMRYKDILRQNLRLLGQELDGKTSPRFITWDDIEPEFKKSLISNKSEYDALEDFAKSLAQHSDNLGKPNLDVYDDLCKTQYERLKRLGLV